MDTQTQIERLIELAIVQRSELKQLVSELPQLREYLSAEIERTFEETEPQIRTELEEFCRARATDEHAKTGAALAAKVEELSKQLEVTTAAKYSVLMSERAENANLLAKAEARIEDAASMLSHAVKEIVTDELSRFPRAGEIDQLRKEFAEPRGLNPRGRWMPDETYQRLDLVTINGDSFVSNIDGNRERPSRTAGDWTLSAARGNGGGGGGVTTMTDLVPVPSNGQLLIGNGSAFVNATLTAGTGISISNGPGSITINATDGNITLDDGTAAAPSLNFTNEPTTGLFRASANVMGFAVAGTSRATMTATGMTVAGTITPSGSVHAAAGTVSNPSLAFNSDQNTGLYNIGADNIGVAAGGAKVLDIATTGLGVTGTLSVSGVATLGAGAILNTPASGTLTNATGLPISTGVSGLGANVATFLATPSSANLAAALTDETGTGANVFATSPTLTTPISATLTSPAATNLTLAGGTAGSDSVVVSNTLAASSAIIGAFKVGNGTAATNVAIGGGKVNIGDTTAGSSGAGALVVQGGISAGNTGAASWFGGMANFTQGLSVSSSSLSSPLELNSTLTSNYLFINSGVGLEAMSRYYNPTAGNWYTGIRASAGLGSTSSYHIYSSVFGADVAVFNTTGAATFAGAVTTGGKLLVNTSVDSSALLQVGTNTTNLAGGMIFGTDTKLYRGGNSNLKLDGTNPSFDIVSGGTVYGRIETDAVSLYISSVPAASLILRTNQTTALTLSSSQAATFAGAVTVTPPNGTAGLRVISAGDQSNLYLESTGLTGGNKNWLISTNFNSAGNLEIRQSNATGGDPRNAGTSMFVISPTGAATFAGAVTVGGKAAINGAALDYDLNVRASTSNLGNTVFRFEQANGSEILQIRDNGTAIFAGDIRIGNTVNTVSPTSPNRTVTILVNGVTLYLAAKTSND